MSTVLSKRLYEGRALENQWINNTISAHDLMCGCQDPIGHFHLLTKEKCLSGEKDSTNVTIGTHGEEETDLDAAALEALFAENQEDDG